MAFEIGRGKPGYSRRRVTYDQNGALIRTAHTE